MSSPVLVLNQTYEVLNATSIRRAMKLLFSGKAEMVKGNGKSLHTPTTSYMIPSVVRLGYYVKIPWKKVPLTRKNVLLRDDFTCQYCGKRSMKGMTVDHVIPRSLGGKTEWENVACACKECNNIKKNRRPGEASLKLSRKPIEPPIRPPGLFTKENYPLEWREYLDGEPPNSN
ncbi:MAG: HNH endonuclease [Chloroflexi bacterium]|nr:HNH endonuclease [Chloroflexota bacterium]